MRLCLVFLFSMVSLISFSQTETEPVGKPATITGLEDDEIVSVYTTPGQAFGYCPPGKVCKPAVGWLDRDAKIKTIGAPVKHLTKEPHNDEMFTEEYRKIQFEYERSGIHQKGEGYISSEYVSETPTKPLYSVKDDKIKKPTCLTKNTDKTFSAITETLTPLTKPVENLSIVQQADQLSQVVGFCPLSPTNKAPTGLPGKSTNLYDHFIKSKLTNKTVPKIMNEDNQQMTQNNLIEIDALSRTMYAEMALCYKSGLQYPMAVAKVILNRSEKTSRHKEFIKPPHSDPKPDIAKVCTTPSQFNCWMQKVDGVKNNTLHHALCPPQKESAPFWKGKTAPKFESDLWKNSVRIATEAVLHPKKFNRRTADIKGYFYTSGMGQFLGMEQETGLKIDGNPINKNRCLEIWMEKSKK